MKIKEKDGTNKHSHKNQRAKEKKEQEEQTWRILYTSGGLMNSKLESFDVELPMCINKALNVPFINGKWVETRGENV